MLETHGIPVVIRWHDVAVGESVFVPGADTRALKLAARQEAAMAGCRVVIEEVVETNMCGIRIWRVG